MKYYEIKQDRNLRNTIEIEGFKGCPNIVLDKEMADKLNRCTTLYVKGTMESQFPDLIQSPVLMISEKMYQIIKYYDTDVDFKIVVLTDLKNKRQEIYRLMLPPVEDVLDESTTYDHNRILDKIVISKKTDAKKKIFYVTEGITHRLIVEQDVIESMLARGSVGVIYNEL